MRGRREHEREHSSSLFGDLPPSARTTTRASSWGKRVLGDDDAATMTTTTKRDDDDAKRRKAESGTGAPQKMKMQQSMVKAQRAKMLRAKTEKLSASATPKITALNNAKEEKSGGERRIDEPTLGEGKGDGGGGGGTVWDCPDEYDPFKPNSYEDAKLQRTRDDEEKKQREKDWMERKKIKEEEREKEKKEKEEKEKKGGGKGMSMAMRMMKKMGWQEGKGLGKNQDGIDAPLVVKKDGRDTGRIIKSKALFSSEKNEIEDELPPDKAQSR
tara:strand:- start:42 stop:854 length:813 start_codon:yes stop_codon:yes gene_type:complete